MPNLAYTHIVNTILIFQSLKFLSVLLNFWLIRQYSNQIQVVRKSFLKNTSYLTVESGFSFSAQRLVYLTQRFTLLKGLPCLECLVPLSIIPSYYSILLIKLVQQSNNFVSVFFLLNNRQLFKFYGLGLNFSGYVLIVSLISSLVLQVLFEFLVSLSPTQIISFPIKQLIVSVLILWQPPELKLKIPHHFLEVPLVVVDIQVLEDAL